MATPSIMPGCEPFSHAGAGGGGVLVLHGFTGNPSSLRLQARAFADAGYHVEQPRLPGHGTTVEDMMTTKWDDWAGEAEAAFHRLAARVDRVAVMGLSMGGSLTLWTALRHPEIAALVCVNPATQPPGDDVIAMVQEMIDDGMEVMPGVGSDIADPDAVEVAYEGTPLRQLLSLASDGLAPLAERYGELQMPLLLFTSRQDHVVEPVNSEYLAACYGGDVDHVWLERSYHVATQDFDRALITDRALRFVGSTIGAPDDA